MSIESESFSSESFFTSSFTTSTSIGPSIGTCNGVTDLEQTLFLGCSVKSFSCNLGWGEQSTEVRVQIAKDPCSGEKIYYDITQSTPRQVYNGVDPGFYIYGDGEDEPPRLGSPVYFRYADFEFCGLLQSWKRIEPSSSIEQYEILLVSPAALLQGVNVIVGDYVGDVGTGFNIINAYGFYEEAAGTSCTTYTDNATDGPIFGSIAGGFGGATRTEAGMPATKVINAIHALTSNLPNTIPGSALESYSYYGRLVYHGANSNAAYGLLPHDDENATIESLFGLESNISYFLVDLSDLPTPPSDYRIPGTSIDLLSLITQICGDLGYDYYLEIVPFRVSGTLYKTIKVRTASRVTQPALNVVSSFITGIEASGGVISSNYGQELRNESNSTFLIGGEKRSIWEVYNGIPGSDPDSAFFAANYPDNTYVQDRIVPFYGLNSTGNPNVLYYDPAGSGVTSYYINLDFGLIKPHLNTISGFLGNSHQITLGEMRAASAGFDSWTSYSKNINSDIRQQLADNDIEINGLWGRISDLTEQAPSGLIARDYVNTIGELANRDPFVREDLKTIQEYIGNIYDISKTTFMARLPYTCVSASNGKIETTDTPAEGGWTEAATVLGLANPGGAIDFFKNEDGSIGTTAVFVGTGLSSVDINSSKYYYPNDSNLYLSATVEPDLVFLDNYSKTSPRVIVSIPEVQEIAQSFRYSNAFDAQTQAINNALVGASGVMSNATGLISNGLEQEFLNYAMAPEYFEPYGLAIPMKSNVHTYGPWQPTNVIEAGPPGRVKVVKDESLVPWTYGSLSALTTVAQAQCNASVTAMIYGETGELYTDGYPRAPLGAELGSLVGLGSKFYSSNEHVIENRTAASSTLNIGSYSLGWRYINYGPWDGSYGPTVTSISTTFGIEGINTQYVFRTFSPKYGFLARLNAERIANRSQQWNHLRNQSRMQNFIQNTQRSNNKQLQSILKKADRIFSQNDKKSIDTSTAVFQGAIHTDGEGKNRPIVNGKPIDKMQEATSTASRYDNTAMMSMEGLLRPISNFGDGGLPRFARNRFAGCAHEISGYYDFMSHWIFETDTPPYPIHLQSELPLLTNSGDFGKGYSRYCHTSMLAAPSRVWEASGDYTGRQNISSMHLNFLSNPCSGEDFYAFENIPATRTEYSTNDGHDIDLLARKTLSAFNTGSGSSNSLSVYSSKNIDVKDYAQDYRFMSLRGPLVMQGWGYDLDGKPIPNANDTPEWMENGVYRIDNLSDNFYSGYLSNSKIWPVAPIDFRFDRIRSVWTTSTEVSPVVGISDTGIYFDGSPELSAHIFDNSSFYMGIQSTGEHFLPSKADGGAFSDARIKVANNFACPINPYGESLYAVPIPRFYGTKSIHESGVYSDYLLVGQDHSNTFWTGYDSENERYQTEDNGIRNIAIGSGIRVDYGYVTSSGVFEKTDNIQDYWDVAPIFSVRAGSGVSFDENNQLTFDLGDIDIDISGEVTVDKNSSVLTEQPGAFAAGPAEKITFGDAFFVSNSAADFLVHGGLKVTVDETCVQGTSDPETTNRYHALDFGKGICARKISDTNLDIGAGFLITNNSATTAEDLEFITHNPAGTNFNNSNPTHGPLFSTINYGQGINADCNTDCELKLGAGVHFIDETNEMVEATNAGLTNDQFYALINIGKGLCFRRGDDNDKLDLGLNLLVNDIQTAVIDVKVPLYVEEQEAEGEIELGLKYGCGLRASASTNNELVVWAEDLAGCGLTTTNTICGLKVKNSDLVGPGLTVYGECGLAVNSAYLQEEVYNYIYEYTQVNNICDCDSTSVNFEQVLEELKEGHLQSTVVVTDIEKFEVEGGELKLWLKRETLNYFGEAADGAASAKDSVPVDTECE